MYQNFQSFENFEVKRFEDFKIFLGFFEDFFGICKIIGDFF